MINLNVLGCRDCGDNCEPIEPSGDLSTAKIVVIYEKPNKQDYDYGQLFENRGCFFARQQLEKHFRPKDVYYTAVQKCTTGNSKTCSNKWLDKEIGSKYIVVMGKSAYLHIPNNKPKEFKTGFVGEHEAYWSSPQLFEQRGQSFLNEFDIFCEEIKRVIEKNS